MGLMAIGAILAYRPVIDSRCALSPGALCGTHHRVHTVKTYCSALLFRLAAAGLLAALAACNLPVEPPVEPAATEATASETPEALEPRLLPAAVLFLSSRSGEAQVWQLAAEGLTQTQLTNEPAGVDGFDVSPLDGGLAYVSDNQLYMRDADGSNRRLMVDNAAADREAADYYAMQRISDPLFSPDGRFLAYAYGGLWILDLESNQAVHLLNNEIDPESEGMQSYYVPLAWAPNSLQLALASGGPGENRLAFVNPGEEPMVTVAQAGVGPPCCQPAWTPDGELLLASPYAGLLEPGLWRYDPLSGERQALLDGEEGLLEFAGWPLPTEAGVLYYFYASAAEPPAGDPPLFMVRGLAGEREPLREEAFANIGEVLWAADGSLALVVQLRPEGGRGGAVLLAHADGRQSQLLLEDGYGLRWGR